MKECSSFEIKEVNESDNSSANSSDSDNNNNNNVIKTNNLIDQIPKLKLGDITNNNNNNISNNDFSMANLIENLQSRWFWKNYNKDTVKISLDYIDMYGFILYKCLFTNCKLTKIITSKLDYSHKTLSTIKCVFKYQDISFIVNVGSNKHNTPTLKQKEQALLILKAQNEMLEDAKQTVIKKNVNNKELVCDAINVAINENIQVVKNDLNLDEKDIKKAKYKKKNKKVIV